MKKEKKEIATNTSSGAEKVEKIEKEISQGGEKTAVKIKTARPAQKEQSAQGDAALGDSVNAKKVNTQAAGSEAEKESAAAKARVEAALKKKEAQAKRKAEKAKKAKAKVAAKAKRAAEKKALAEKRAAERKALIEKRAAERKALAEKRKAQKEAATRERAHKKANKNQQNSRKNASKKEKKENGERNKGYGGWLAAVISLGAVTLALSTVVTVGAMDMRRTKNAVLMSNKGTMYELTGIMEHVDDDLDRARISASPAQQSRILTDLLVQARLAELDLEKLPIDGETDRNLTAFINRTAMESERMLAKLRKGEALNDKDFETIEGLYRTNHTIRQELDTLMEKMQDKDLKDYMKDAKGAIGDVLGRLEELTMEENRAAFEQKKDEMKGAGKQRKAEEPSNDSEPTRLEQARAEELCMQYFVDYNIKEFQCIGETVSRSYAAYNVQGYDDKGTMLFAEIDQKSGDLLRFDYYEDCKVENFDVDNAKRIAEQFLETLGYEDMEAVRLRENGTTTDFTFVYEDDDVVYYPDEIRIKVCRTRGLVTGMDATKYLQHHKDREEPSVKISLGEAYERLHEKLSVESSRLAVIKAAGGETAAYEFLCSYEDEMYFVYLSAETGEEISIVNARAVG